MNIPRLQKILIGVALLIVVALVATAVSIKFNTNKTSIVEKPKVVGVVQLWDELDRFHEGFKKGMNELGYTEGKDVVYDYQNWEQDPTKIDGIVQRHIDNNVDLLYVVGNPSAEAALRLTKTAGKNIPIIYVLTDKPVESKLAESLKSSGNNSTGITNNMSELVPKQLEFLKQISPNMKKIAIYGKGFHVPGGVGALVVEALNEQAPKFGLTVIEYTTDVSPGPNLEAEFERIASAIKPGDIDAQMHIPGHFIADQHHLEIAHAKRLKIPTAMPILEEMEAGGLYSYAADLFAVGEQASVMADKIFKGTNPSNIPIEFPKKNILGINIKAEKETGVIIPDSMKAIASMVVGE